MICLWAKYDFYENRDNEFARKIPKISQFRNIKDNNYSFKNSNHDRMVVKQYENSFAKSKFQKIQKFF